MKLINTSEINLCASQNCLTQWVIVFLQEIELNGKFYQVDDEIKS